MPAARLLGLILTGSQGSRAYCTVKLLGCDRISGAGDAMGMQLLAEGDSHWSFLCANAQRQHPA